MTLMNSGKSGLDMASTASQNGKGGQSFKPVLNRLPDSRIAWLRQQKKSVAAAFDVWVAKRGALESAHLELRAPSPTLDKPAQPDQ